MQGQAQQQAYDRGITIFSPDGRLYQVEYAREAVKRGTASIGVKTAGGVVLAVDKRIPSTLLFSKSGEGIRLSTANTTPPAVLIPMLAVPRLTASRAYST